jgi:hypothetical protein
MLGTIEVGDFRIPGQCDISLRMTAQPGQGMLGWAEKSFFAPTVFFMERWGEA